MVDISWLTMVWWFMVLNDDIHWKYLLTISKRSHFQSVRKPWVIGVRPLWTPRHITPEGSNFVVYVDSTQHPGLEVSFSWAPVGVKHRQFISFWWEIHRCHFVGQTPNWLYRFCPTFIYIRDVKHGYVVWYIYIIWIDLFISPRQNTVSTACHCRCTNICEDVL